MPKTNSSYVCGQAEAALDIVPGLMSHDYVLGRLDAKKGKKNSGKSKPGFDWVEDPSVKGGGYFRKAKKSAGSSNVAKAVAGAALIGAGAAAIAASRRSPTPQPSSLVTPAVNAVRQGVNKKAVAAAATGIAATGVGVAAMRSRTSRPTAPESRMPKGSKTEFKGVGDPWEGEVSGVAGQAQRTANSQSMTPQMRGAEPLPESRGLPPAGSSRANPQSVEVIRRAATPEETQTIREIKDLEQARNNPNRRRNITEAISRPEIEESEVLNDRLLGTSERAKSIKEALKVDGFDQETGDRVNRAVDLVSKVVNIPGLPKIDVIPMSKPEMARQAMPEYPQIEDTVRNLSDKANGLYQPINYTDRKTGQSYASIPRFIAVNDRMSPSFLERDTLHEAGHFVDHAAIGQMRDGYGSSKGEPVMEKFMREAANTKTIQEIAKAGQKSKNPLVQQDAARLMDRKEVFARAFAQYVATKSGSKVVQSQIKANEGAKKGGYWTEQEFKKTIEPAMDEMFKTLGWR